MLTQIYEGRAIYIGDVAFEARSEHDKCMKQVGNAWDKDGFYFVADEMKLYFPEIKFKKISECA